MDDLAKSRIIEQHPIGKGLDAFRSTYNLDLVKGLSDDALRNLAINLFHALQNFPAASQLPSARSRENLRVDLLHFSLLAVSEDLDIKSVIPLLLAVGRNESDEQIWLRFYSLATTSTPPLHQLPYPHQTPISFNTGSFVNTSENRKHFDGALRDELDSSLYIDIPGFFDAFFGEIPNLMLVANAVFQKCKEGKDPLYSEEDGWRDWPKDAKEDEVLR